LGDGFEYSRFGAGFLFVLEGLMMYPSYPFDYRIVVIFAKNTDTAIEYTVPKPCLLIDFW